MATPTAPSWLSQAQEQYFRQQDADLPPASVACRFSNVEQMYQLFQQRFDFYPFTTAPLLGPLDQLTTALQYRLNTLPTSFEKGVATEPLHGMVAVLQDLFKCLLTECQVATSQFEELLSQIGLGARMPAPDVTYASTNWSLFSRIVAAVTEIDWYLGSLPGGLSYPPPPPRTVLCNSVRPPYTEEELGNARNATYDRKSIIHLSQTVVDYRQSSKIAGPEPASFALPPQSGERSTNQAFFEHVSGQTKQKLKLHPANGLAGFCARLVVYTQYLQTRVSFFPFLLLFEQGDKELNNAVVISHRMLQTSKTTPAFLTSRSPPTAHHPSPSFYHL
jgi:hypothetical protein